MNEQEKTEWIKRNIDCYSDEAEARADLERRIAEKEAKESRVLRTFNNLDEFRAYEKDHKMGQWWDDFDNDTICSYEYK